MDNFYIRKAKKTDLDIIAKLSSELYITEQAFDRNIKDGYYETENGMKGLLKDIRKYKSLFLVAVYNNNVVGYVNGDIIDKPDVYKEKMAYLDRLVVSKESNRKGFGAKLINEFVKQMKDNGCKFVKINVFNTNIPAVSLYKKEGFYEYSAYYMKKI